MTTPTPTTTSTPPRTGSDCRREILAQVEKCVCADRQATYSDAEDNFARIAEIWSVLLSSRLKPGEKITRLDVAACCAGIKMARLVSSPRHMDNWVDLAGYAVCGGGIVQREQEQQGKVQELEAEPVPTPPEEIAGARLFAQLKQPLPEPGDGCRLLRRGEMLRLMDAWWDLDRKAWIGTPQASDGREATDTVYRRRTAPGVIAGALYFLRKGWDMPDPGPGFRLLLEGEILLHTDEVFQVDKLKWQPTRCAGRQAGDGATDAIYRRKL